VTNAEIAFYGMGGKSKPAGTGSDILALKNMAEH